MKVLLIQTLDYLSFTGGAHKANRIMLEGLSQRGHSCRVLCPPPGPTSLGADDHRRALTERGIAVHQSDASSIACLHNGVDVRIVTATPAWVRTDSQQPVRVRARLRGGIRR